MGVEYASHAESQGGLKKLVHLEDVLYFHAIIYSRHNKLPYNANGHRLYDALPESSTQMEHLD